MAKTSKRINVYIEKGQKQTFAGAIHWPGWCRSGSDEASALQALLDHGPRYARVLRAEEFAFQAPISISALNVIERMKGNATTDFGAPSLAPSADAEAINDAELQRCQAILKPAGNSSMRRPDPLVERNCARDLVEVAANWMALFSTFWGAIPVIFRSLPQKSSWMKRHRPARS